MQKKNPLTILDVRRPKNDFVMASNVRCAKNNENAQVN